MLLRVIGILCVVAALGAALFYSQHRSDPLKVSGLIEADEIRVGSRVGGRVHQVHAVEGLVAKTGDVLVVIEPFDLLEKRAEIEKTLEARRADFERISAGFRPEEIAEAKAHRDQLAARLDKLVHGPRPQEIAVGEAQRDLAEAESQLAQLQFDRIKSLASRNATTREEMDRASAELKKSRAQLEVRREELSQLKEGTRREDIADAKAQLGEAEEAWKLRSKGYRAEDIAQAKASMESVQAALRTIDRQIEELTIKSPVDGVIEAVELHPGDLVSANAPVISLMDTRSLWVRAYVPENRLRQEVGEKAQVSVDSFPGQRFAAHLSFIARQAEFTPGNIQTPEERSKQVFRIKVVLDEGLDRLRPGMSADVWLGDAGSGP
ncbi:MAG: HlyD family efflux transporter periplasmic adaptor subunit [Planctomycetia bacterium]|nr:HlyD family efflux transporter periplasmic adaptor subunit [Planctomycetia bacterium]